MCARAHAISDNLKVGRVFLPTFFVQKIFCRIVETAKVGACDLPVASIYRGGGCCYGGVITIGVFVFKKKTAPRTS